LASSCARAGQRTLLVVQQPADARHPQLDVDALYTPRAVGANLDLCSIDGRSALKEYVQRTMPMHALYDWFLDSRAIRHFTEAAPGFDELMCLGKLYDLVTESDYARVIFDAPATGHASLMLRVPRTTAAAVRSGPLHSNAQKIEALLTDPVRTCVAIVALAEEMAVREALELSRYVGSELGIALAPFVVNRVTPQSFASSEIAALNAIHPESQAPSPGLLRMIRAASIRHRRAAAEAEHIATLRNECADLVTVPEVVLARHGVALIDAMVPHLGKLTCGASDD
jgi:anion-transporting  ArsA/GET3 family ATPase